MTTKSAVGGLHARILTFALKVHVAKRGEESKTQLLVKHATVTRIPSKRVGKWPFRFLLAAAHVYGTRGAAIIGRSGPILGAVTVYAARPGGKFQ